MHVALQGQKLSRPGGFEVTDTPVADWPADKLEYLGACPVCGGKERRLRFEGVTDKSFQHAPGRWSLYDCPDCGALYLDPRPSLASIGEAYGRYYTHETPDPKRLPSRRRDPRSRMGAAYLNRTYGYGFSHAFPDFLARALISEREKTRLDYMIRHLPAPSKPGQTLLDVGCSNGGFLVLARDLGYAPTGVEPDPQAVEAGRRAGLDILVGGLEHPDLVPASFDQVTLSHVLEHLHDPKAALVRILALLKPGGRLWLSQPNLGALGLMRFGADWRGLEAPRHMTLFGPHDLVRLVQSLGFVDVQLLPADRAAGYYYSQSACMAQGRDPQTNRPSNASAIEAEAREADRQSRQNPELGESLTLIAFRPQP